MSSILNSPEQRGSRAQAGRHSGFPVSRPAGRRPVAAHRVAGAAWGLLLLLALPGAQAESPTVDRSHVREAFFRAEGWLEAGEVGESAGESIQVNGLLGVRVTLRWLGLAVGRGEVTLDPELTEPPAGRDLAAAVHLATDRAARSFEATLDRAEARAGEGAGHNGQEGDRPDLKAMAPSLQVELQVAKRLVPVALPDSAPAEAIFFTFASGHHGLRLRPPEPESGIDAWMWPATALARNIQPRQQMMQLLDAIGRAPTAIPAVARTGGPRLARFEVIHLLRPHDEADPMPLVRGDRLLAGDRVNEALLAREADRLAAFLLRRQQADGGFAGTYLPAADRYDPATADLGATGLAALALARHARWRRAREAEAQSAWEGAVLAMAYLAEAIRNPGTPDPEEAADARALLLLGLEAGVDVDGESELRRTSLAWLLKRIGPEGLLRSGPEADAAPLPEAVQARAFAAIARRAARTQEAALLEASRALRRRWFEAAPPPSDPRGLPWLLEAHRALPSDEARTSLAEWADRLEDRQIRDRPALGPADILGGYDLSNPPAALSAIVPLADSRSASVIRLLAGRLRHDPPRDPLEQLEAMLALTQGGRFLSQLVFDRTSAWYARSRTDVVDGMRYGPFDNRLATRTSAEGLLAFTSLEQTLASETMQQVLEMMTGGTRSR